MKNYNLFIEKMHNLENTKIKKLDNEKKQLEKINKNLENKKFKLNSKLPNDIKRHILELKTKIINSNTAIKKYRHYLELIKYLKSIYLINNKYENNIFIDYKINNKKIANSDTIIFSISTAIICYSAIKNYCQLYSNKKCYALKNELQYNSSILYKHRQYLQFKKLKAWQLARYFIRIKKLYPKIKYLRLNESGELQKKHMQKINKIADILKKYDIKIYSYTHNKELNKNHITSDNFTLNSSNKNIKLCNRFLSYDKAKNNRIMNIKKNSKIKKCIANCTICKLCTFKNDYTILCNIH